MRERTMQRLMCSSRGFQQQIFKTIRAPVELLQHHHQRQQHKACTQKAITQAFLHHHYFIHLHLMAKWGSIELLHLTAKEVCHLISFFGFQNLCFFHAKKKGLIFDISKCKTTNRANSCSFSFWSIYELHAE